MSDIEKVASLYDRLLIVKDGVSEYAIYTEDEPTVRFAGEQLQAYIQRITGVCLPIADDLTKYSHYMILGTSDFEPVKAYSKKDSLRFDGFSIFNDCNNAYFTSNYSRGVLFAVYEFLEQQGCIFVQAAKSSEYIPKSDQIVLNKTMQNPSLEFRGITEAPLECTQEWVNEYLRIIDNASKNKINSIFIHCKIDQELVGVVSVIAEEIKKRGLILEIGGHGAERLIPDDFFDDKPYLFREKEGQRTKTGNICASSNEAIDIINKKIDDYLIRNPFVDILHCWFEDVEGGSWCSCDKCKEIPPIEQQFSVLSRMSKDINRKHPDKHIDMLLYHDTIIGVSDLDVRNDQGIYGFFAPRERCYAHGLDDENCSVNKAYLQALKDTVSTFGEDYSYVFEYYGDLILYVKNKTNFAHTISSDIKAYIKNGIRKVTTLCFGAYSNWAYPLNIFVFARHSWNSELNVEDTIELFSKGLGFNGSDYIKYLDLIEKASVQTYAFCGYGIQFGDIRVLPIEPVEYYKEHIEKIQKAIELLAKAEELLNKMISRANVKNVDHLKAESVIIKITQLETEAIYTRMYSRYMNKVYPGKLSSFELQQYGEKVVELQKQMIEIIKTVPLEIKGTVGNKTFPNHLCEEQIDIMQDVMKKEFNLSD